MASHKRLLTAAALLAAISLLVMLPGYLASRPSFFSRYPALSDKYGPWSKSTHLEAGCEGCHVPPGTISRAGYRVRMVGEFYLSTVSAKRTPDLFSTPTNEACLACHNDLRTVSPEGDLQIPHRAHVNVLKMKCVQCHDFLVHEKSPEGKHTPPMAGCMKCHNGDTAKNSCSACHTQKDAPDSHRTGAWLVEHGTTPADERCQKCHKWADDWCADCHSQRPASHGANWRDVHGEAVKKHRSCEACHDGDFCVKCHGEVPGLNLRADLKMVR